MPRKSKKKLARPGGRRNPYGGWGVPRPPSFVPTIRALHSFRWIVATTGTFSVNSDNMLNWFVAAVTSTTTTRIIEALRIRRVSVWGQPPALGAAATTVSVEWHGPFSTDSKHSDTSSGIAPAYVTTTPPKQSSSGWWYDNSATNVLMFDVVGPVGSTVQVEVEILLVDDTAAISGPSASGASAGRIYGTNLVGTSQTTSTATTPVGLTALP